MKPKLKLVITIGKPERYTQISANCDTMDDVMDVLSFFLKTCTILQIEVIDAGA